MGVDQARRREAVKVVWRHAKPWQRCAVWWRDGPEAARACNARRVCVHEAAHVRLGATMAIELAEKRKAIVCVVGVVYVDDRFSGSFEVSSGTCRLWGGIQPSFLRTLVHYPKWNLECSPRFSHATHEARTTRECAPLHVPLLVAPGHTFVFQRMSLLSPSYKGVITSIVYTKARYIRLQSTTAFKKSFVSLHTLACQFICVVSRSSRSSKCRHALSDVARRQSQVVRRERDARRP